MELDEGENLSCVLQKELLIPKADSRPQRQSLFKTRCTVKGKICNVIVDSGSSENIVSKKLVNALNLPMEPHPNPYKVGWIKKGGEAQVSNICTVSIFHWQQLQGSNFLRCSRHGCLPYLTWPSDLHIRFPHQPYLQCS